MIPFGEALAPFARRALPGLGPLAPCKADLEHALLRTLSFVCAPALFEVFARRRDARFPLPQLWPEGDALYRAFLGELRDESGWGEIERQYGALLPLVRQVVRQWEENTAALDERLARDQRLLAAVFAASGALGRVEIPLSDRHHGGRTVARLHFENGARVIYKPRSLQMEAGWSAIVSELGLYAPAVAPREGYGWMEDVPPRPLADRDAAARYYRRAGALLCAAYVLEGTDFHFDNLVAHGEHPVLVDLEGLLAPRLGDLFRPDEDDAVAAADARLWGSVVRTRLLPRWTSDGVDLSGLGALAEQTLPRRVRRFHEPATDRMEVGWTPAVAKPEANVPSLDGIAVPPEEHEDDLVDGFREAFATLSRRPPSLDPFLNAVSRLIIRPTRLYQAVLVESTEPEAMRSPAARRAVLARLASATGRVWPTLAEGELAALERLDIPWFGVAVDGNEGEGMAFAESAMDRVRSRLRALHADECDFQCSLIRLSLAARKGQALPLPSAEELERRAIRGAHGGVTWIGLREASGRLELAPLDRQARSPYLRRLSGPVVS
jgi:type 2 lantibiotic biosynthesis protein LanM